MAGALLPSQWRGLGGGEGPRQVPVECVEVAHAPLCWDLLRGGAEAPLGAQVPTWLQPWGRVLERGVSVGPYPGVRMTLLPAPWAELKLGVIQCEEPWDELTELQAGCAVTPWPIGRSTWGCTA